MNPTDLRKLADRLDPTEPVDAQVAEALRNASDQLEKLEKLEPWEVWADVPNQDHCRSWFRIGEVKTLEEYDSLVEKYIAHWEPTSNVLRLREPGSFELRKKGKT